MRNDVKTILFFSLEEGAMGGVASVNDTLKKALEARGHRVLSLYLRAQRHEDGKMTIRQNRPWSLTRGCEIKKAIRQGKFFFALLLFLRRLLETAAYQKDLSRAKTIIAKAAPDAIIPSHYLLLDGVPKGLLSRTLHHVHTSFDATMENPATRKALMRYNGKIGFLWLSRGVCEKAEKAGLTPSFFLYNPLPHMPEERTEAETQTTVSILTRFSPEKRLPLAVSLLQKALDSLPNPDAFSVKFYGEGPEDDALQKAVEGDGRFALMGRVPSPWEPLSQTRFTINTSLFEGFPMSVLEALAAGVPTVSFVFGEAAGELICSEETGILLDMDDHDGFVHSLTRLFTDPELVQKLSLNARAYAERFQKEIIAEEWETLLEKLPLDKIGK